SNQPVNPLEAAPSAPKTRFSARAKEPKKAKTPSADSQAPLAPTTSEVADRATQSAPLGLNGDTSQKKKKTPNAVTEKPRYAQEKKKEEDNATPPQPTPIAPVPGAPAPAGTTQPQPQQQ